MTYFGHNSFCFLLFQNSRQICGSGEGGGRKGGGRQGGDGQGRVGHISTGIILSASYLLGFDLVLFYV